jgi:hypothetical protein
LHLTETQCGQIVDQAIREHGQAILHSDGTCSVQKVASHDDSKATHRLNSAEADFVDGRSAAQARQRAVEMLKPFCDRHPSADACNQQE